MRMTSKLGGAALSAVLALAACDQAPVISPNDAAHYERAWAAATIGNANVVEVTAHHADGGGYAFTLSDDVIPSGWTTFELDNHSGANHFVLVAKVPDQALVDAQEAGMDLLDYWVHHITEPFQFIMDDIIPDKEPNLEYAERFPFPEWFEQGDVVNMGGPGLTAGFTSSRTTIHLDEGVYILECYVKSGDGDFHSYLGMIAKLEVSDEAARTPEPTATLAMTLSSTGGIEVDGDIRPGLHTIRVDFADQAIYEHLVGHDVHLVRLDGTDVTDVAEWMSWMDPDGLVSTSANPGPGAFMGGAQSMEAGGTAYFTVILTPGDYAWISEVPANAEMWQTFTVPYGRSTGR